MTIISRKAGRSSTAAAAYRAGVRLTDERTGEVHDYARKRGVVLAEVHVPADAPAWAQDRATLWNAVEQKNTRRDAQVAREIVVALPAALDAGQRADLARTFAREIAHDYHVGVDLAIHQPGRQGDERNHHAHLLLTTNRLDCQGLGNKVRELDGIAAQRNSQDQGNAVDRLRVRWAELTNAALERAGIEARIDHRTLKAQGIDRVPQIHLGPNVTEMEQRGIRTERGDQARDIERRNGTLRALRAERDTVLDAEQCERAEGQRRQAQRPRPAQTVEAAAHAGQKQEGTQTVLKGKSGYWTGSDWGALTDAQLYPSGRAAFQEALQLKRDFDNDIELHIMVGKAAFYGWTTKASANKPLGRKLWEINFNEPYPTDVYDAHQEPIEQQKRERQMQAQERQAQAWERQLEDARETLGLQSFLPLQSKAQPEREAQEPREPREREPREQDTREATERQRAPRQAPERERQGGRARPRGKDRDGWER